MVQAVVLAAGEGSRLRPLTLAESKPMLRVGNKPILQYVVEALAECGVEDVTLVVGYQRRRVQSHFEDGSRFGVRIDYAFQEALLGTAHALATARVEEDAFLVLGGDNVVDAGLVGELLEAPGPVTLAAKPSAAASQYGVLTLKGDRVLRIDEQPPGVAEGPVSLGAYRITRKFHEYATVLVQEGVTGIPGVLQRAIGDGWDVRARLTRGLWMDAVYPWDLLALNEGLVNGRGGARLPGEGEGLVVPPCRIEGDADIGPSCVVLPSTSIGRNVAVGAGSIIENSILMDDVQVGPGSLLRNTVVGEGARVGERFTALSGPASVRVADECMEVSDFGVVIGAGSVIEGGVTVKPGVLIGHRARVAAGTVVSRNVEDEGIVQ